MLKFSGEVKSALAAGRPVVALESTVISHGLPRPINVETALRLEQIVRDNGAIPATIAVFDGVPHVGLDHEQLRFLAENGDIHKLSRRDLPVALACRWNGATTVATTIFFAHQAGIPVFATGGIGGVHRGALPDVSADLPELAGTPLTVVCSGAKIILDLPATREHLETHSVTIVGYECDELPAFYSRTSGLPVDTRVDSPQAAADVIRARDNLKMQNAILIAVPVPRAAEIPVQTAETIVQNALLEAEQQRIAGKEITPFLLHRMAEASDGATLRANIALLENNVRVAALIAAALS